MSGVKSTPLKIVMVSPAGIANPDGGITQLLSYFLRGLRGQGSHVLVDIFQTRTSSGYLSKHLSSLRQLFRFYRKLSAENIDIVHLHVAPRGSTYRKLFFARVAQRKGSKVVLHLHGSGYDEFYRRQPNFLKRKIAHLFQSADAVIALGQRWVNFVSDELGVTERRIFSINNGVPAFSGEPSTRVAKNSPLILFAGAVGQRKGVDVLIEALGQIRHLNWDCEICGDGDIPAYKEICRSRGVFDRVEFAGWQGERAIRDKMSEADIFVLPSRAENQPVAIIEAMAQCLPVVSTEVGDIPNQVENGKTGFVVAPSNAAALAEKLSILLKEPEMRHRMGVAGRKRFEKEFSINQNIDKTLALYEQIAACGSRRLGRNPLVRKFHKGLKIE